MDIVAIATTQLRNKHPPPKPPWLTTNPISHPWMLVASLLQPRGLD